jgi:hypothetical protein
VNTVFKSHSASQDKKKTKKKHQQQKNNNKKTTKLVFEGRSSLFTGEFVI